ncbi:MAG: hypothetical protein V4511_14860 [Bacteroidota bacterium]
MNRILLVFDDIKELEHIEINLTRNGFKILKSSSLKDALAKAEGSMPDLIVVNTLDVEKEVELFSKQVKMKYLKKALLPSLIELEDYLNIQTREHLVIRELLRNKKYRNNEIVFYISKKELVSRPN